MTKYGDILVMEDNDGLRDTFKELLEIEGFNVHVARNGKEGLEALEHMDQPCMIFLDMMMPVMDGWQFLDVLKTKDLHIPVTVVSAAADLMEVQRRYEVKVLQKPFDVEVLFQAAREHCEVCR